VPCEYSFAELDAMSMAVARALARRNFARGDRIAIVSANRAEFLAAYYGVMRAGLVAVPVNYRFPRQTIHFIIKDAGAKLGVCRPRAARIVRPICGGGVCGGEDSFEIRRSWGCLNRVVPKAGGDPGCSSTHSRFTEPQRASCCRTRATSGLVGRGAALARARAARYHDRGAALSHERAGAPKLACAAQCHYRAAAALEARSYIEA
jgi:hypothetical protein